MTIFCDAGTAGFDRHLFPDVHLESPRAGARDFIEFYDGALRYPCEYLFFIDADVFLLDGQWPASYFAAFDAPEVAAVSLLHRPELPGSIYALICRREDYRRLAPPVLPAYWDALDAWPSSIHRDPGALAALRLAAAGKRIVMAGAGEMDAHLTDFHGTTNLRVCRESWAQLIGDPQFESLIARKPYFARGAYDNILLGWLYERVFGAPFAPGPDGEPLAGSVTVAALRRILGEVRDPTLQERIARDYAAPNGPSPASRLARASRWSSEVLPDCELVGGFAPFRPPRSPSARLSLPPPRFECAGKAAPDGVTSTRLYGRSSAPGRGTKNRDQSIMGGSRPRRAPAAWRRPAAGQAHAQVVR